MSQGTLTSEQDEAGVALSETEVTSSYPAWPRFPSRMVPKAPTEHLSWTWFEVTQEHKI